MANSLMPTPAMEKLVGRENFSTWKFAMKTYLEHEELWECIIGTDTDLKRNTKAKAKIILSIDTINYVHVESAKSAKEAWDNLIKAFEDSGLTRKVGLLRSLITMQFENCSSIEDYVNKVITNSHKLSNIGFKVEDKWIGTLLLAGLPEHYKPMIMALESSGTPITSDAVKVKLLQDIKSSSDTTGQSSNALYGKTNSSITKPTGKIIRCYECNKLGHLAKNCYRRNSRKKMDHYNKPVYKSLLSVMSTGTVNQQDWYIDSGASVHITNNGSDLQDVKRPTKQSIVLADSSTVPIDAMGDLKMDVRTKGIVETVKIEDIMHVPKATTNLLSVSKITSKGNKVVFDSKECKIYDIKGNLFASAANIDGMYRLNRNVPKVNFVSSLSNYNLWHNRFGHPSAEVMRIINDKQILRTKLQVPEKGQCDICVRGKQSRLPFKREEKSSRDILELIHTDVCGPIEEKSLGGSRYFLTFIDDHSRKVFIYFIKSKDEVYSKFIEFKTYVEKQSDKRIKIVRSDNGTEYTNTRMQQYFKQEGIKHEVTIPYTPEQNGLAERMNRTIVEKMRCLYIGANLEKRFWAEAANTAVYLINRIPSRAIDNKIPEEIWTGRKINLSYLKVFGSKAMAHIPTERRRKLDSKSEDCIHVGYAANSKGYRLYNLRSRKIIERRNVIFFENQFLKENTNEYEESKNVVSLDPVDNTENEIEKLSINDNQDIQEEEGTDAEVPSEDREESSSSDDYEETVEEIEPPVEIPRRSSRTPKPKIFENFYNLNATVANETPLTVEEARKDAEAAKWEEAMREEYESLLSNNPIGPVDRNI